MRAVVFAEPWRMSVQEVGDPIPGPREVQVRVAAVGMCGTDLHVFEGEFAPTVFPIIPGHETSATVSAVGDEVTELAVGDRVSVDPTLTCGECEFCANGQANLCLSWNGAGVARDDGSAAELMVAPVKNVHRLPDGVDLHLAAMIEPLSCAIRGYDLLPRRLGEHYLIYGAGTMGLLMAQLAPRAGAASVSVVDRNVDRLTAAREVGVELVAETADAFSRPRGWEVVIDCTGVVAAIEDGLTRVRRGGTFQQFGVAPTDAQARFSPFRVYNDELHVVGSMAVLNSYSRAVEMFAAGAIRADRMVSHAYGLDDYAEAMAAFRSGRGRKLQIRPELTEPVALL